MGLFRSRYEDRVYRISSDRREWRALRSGMGRCCHQLGFGAGLPSNNFRLRALCGSFMGDLHPWQVVNRASGLP